MSFHYWCHFQKWKNTTRKYCS